MDFLKSELHCHNVYSNFNLGEKETPYDCGIPISEQLHHAKKMGLHALAITNHNTTNGYLQALEYRRDHESLRGITIMPAEEVTTQEGIHVIGYGIHEEIRPNLPLGEVLDLIYDQGAVSCAPHPFGLNNGLRDQSAMCDMIEVFNANNVDKLSNVKAASFANKKKMIPIVGSDSHVLQTLGRSFNLVESEATVDGLVSSIKKGRVKTGSTGYITNKEMIEHAKYKIVNSKEYILDLIGNSHPSLVRPCKLLIQMFERYPQSLLWRIIYEIAVRMCCRLSDRINFKDYDYSSVYKRDIRALIPLLFYF